MTSKRRLAHSLAFGNTISVVWSWQTTFDMITLREIMTGPVTVVSPTTTIRDAAKLMQSEKIGMLPVTNGTRLIGVVTDRDLVTRIIANDLAIDEVTVQHAMTPDPLTARETDSLGLAIARMAANQVSRILIVDDEGLLRGVVTANASATAALRLGNEVSMQLLRALHQAHEKPVSV